MRTANGLEEFYSRNFNDDECEYFVDRNYDFTLDYPHVHIIHRRFFVEVVASQDYGDHVWRTRIDNPDGNQVDEAIQEAIDNLEWDDDIL